MGRPKKQIKLKEPVRLLEKLLKDGNRSLYLDIYHKGIRKYEYLKLYLVPEITPFDKAHNRETIKVAEQIKAERILQVQGHGIGQWDIIKKASMPLVKWMADYAIHPTIKLEPSSMKIREECRKVVEEYLDSIGKPSLSLEEVDRDFCRNYINYCRTLTNRRVKKEVRPLSQNTKNRYQVTLCAALNHAVREGIIATNPFSQIPAEEKIAEKEGDREFLTIQEIKKLIDTPCRRQEVKNAFLFSCYTGLRLSDIRSLNANHICKSADGTLEYIDMEMTKTDQEVVVPLSAEAKKYLPEQPEYGKPFFNLPSSIVTIGRAIKKWVEAAGINKHITYHTSRRTFATLTLSVCNNLKQVSVLLGHKSIENTQRYAEVMLADKADAVNRMDSVSLQR